MVASDGGVERFNGGRLGRNWKLGVTGGGNNEHRGGWIAGIRAAREMLVWVTVEYRADGAPEKYSYV